MPNIPYTSLTVYNSIISEIGTYLELHTFLLHTVAFAYIKLVAQYSSLCQSAT